MLFTNVVFPDDVAYSTCLMNQRVLKEQKLFKCKLSMVKRTTFKAKGKVAKLMLWIGLLNKAALVFLEKFPYPSNEREENMADI
jgi:hypothetical protein